MDRSRFLSIFLFLVIAWTVVFAQDIIEDVEDDVDQVHIGNAGFLNSVGSFATSIVKSIIGSDKGVLKEALSSRENPILAKTLSLSFEKHSGILIIIIAGCMVTVLTIFAVCVLYVCRVNIRSNILRPEIDISTSALQERPKYSGLVLFGLMLSIALVTTGCAFVLISAGELRESNNRIFGVLRKTTKNFFKFKNSFHNKLNELPYELAKIIIDSTETFHKYEEQIQAKFRETIGVYTDPMMSTANVVDHSIHALLQEEILQKEAVDQIVEKTTNLGSSVSRFRDIIGVMRSATAVQFPNAGSLRILDVLLEIPELKLSLDFYQDFHHEHQMLNQSDQRPFFAPVSWIASEMLDVAAEIKLDTSDIIMQIRRIGYNLVRRNKKDVQAFTEEMNNILPSGSEQYTQAMIENEKNRTMVILNAVYPTCISVGVGGLFIIFPLMIGIIIGLVGTKCMGYCGSDGYRKTILSHKGSKVIEGQVFVSAFVLWVFWVLAILLFIMTIVPTEICMNIGQKQIANISIGALTHKATINGTATVNIRDVLTDCHHQKNFSQSLGLRKMFDVLDADFDTLKAEFTFDETVPKKLIDKVPLVDVEYMEEFFLTMRKFRKNKDEQNEKLGYLFDDLNFFTRGIKNTFRRKLTELEHSSNLIAIVKQNLKKIRFAFDLIEANSSGALSQSKELQYRLGDELHLLRDMNRKVFQLLKDSRKLNDFIRQNASAALTADVFGVVNSNVNGWKFSMKYLLMEQERRKTNCNALSIMYQHAQHFTCSKYVHIVATAWLGECLAAGFLLCAFLLSIPAIQYFQLTSANIRTSSSVHDGPEPKTKFANLRRDTFDLAMMSDGGATLKSQKVKSAHLGWFGMKHPSKRSDADIDTISEEQEIQDSLSSPSGKRERSGFRSTTNQSSGMSSTDASSKKVD